MMHDGTSGGGTMVHGGTSGGGTMVHGGTSGGGTRWCTMVHGGRMKWVICIYIQWVAAAKCEEQMYNVIYSATAREAGEVRREQHVVSAGAWYLL